MTKLGNGLVESRDYNVQPATGLTCVRLEVPGVTTFSYSYDANKWKQEERVTTAPGETQRFLRLTVSQPMTTRVASSPGPGAAPRRRLDPEPRGRLEADTARRSC